MKRSIINTLNELNARIMGHVAVMSYGYCQLCVKADASSILGFEQTWNGLPRKIEDLADVYVHTEEGDDDKLDLFPKRSEYLPLLAKGIVEIHPEFKQDLLTFEGVDKEDEDNPDAKYLRLIMPEVNKDRRDVIMEAIDLLYKQCVAKLDALKVKYGVMITKQTVTSDPAAVKEAQDTLTEQIDQGKEMCENLTAEKRKEVEDAYQSYLTQQEHSGEAQKKDTRIGQQLKMD